MTQTQFVGAPQGAIWGYDPTTNLWLPIGASPKLVGPNGEIYGSLLVDVTNTNANGQNTMQNSAPVALASDQATMANPLIEESSGIKASKIGIRYVASTGILTATVGPYMAISFFNGAGNTKTAHFDRIIGWYTTTANHPLFQFYAETSDPSTLWTSPVAVTPANLQIGSVNTSVLTVNRTSTANLASQAGTALFTADAAVGTDVELLGSSGIVGIDVPPGKGLTIYIDAINTTVFAVSAFYYEQ
jgi:hypothetical protein